MNLLDGDVTIGIRPEDVDVNASPTAGADEVMPTLIEQLGNESLVTFDYRGQQLVARVPADRSIEPNRPAWIRLPPDRVLAFDASTGQRIDS
jgi:ABC-type sugar transport system ATPase subunit